MASRFLSTGSYFDDEHALDTFERQAGESLTIAMERLRIILDRALITETPDDLITMRNERMLCILPSLVSSHTATSTSTTDDLETSELTSKMYAELNITEPRAWPDKMYDRDTPVPGHNHS